MSILRPLLYFSSILTCVPACGSTDVYKVSSTNNGGVPFFPLVPVNKEVRIFEQRWSRVDVTVRKLVPVKGDGAGGKQPSGKAGAANAATKEATDTIVLFACGSDSDGAVKALLAAVSGARDWDKVQALLTKPTPAGEWCFVEPAPIGVSDLKAVQAQKLVGVQRGIEQLPATARNYINVVAPRGGSATAEVHVDTRGTLTQANGGVQDQLPPAVLSAIGTVGGAALSALGTVGAAAIKTTALLPPSGVEFPAESEKAIVSGITVTVAPARRTYTVTMLWPLNNVPDAASPTFEDASLNPCLALATPDLHDNGCMLSVATDASAAPAPAAPAK